MIFMPAHNNIRSAAHGSWNHFDFEVLFLRNIFCKAIAAIDTDASKGSGQSQMDIQRSLEEVDPVLMDSLEGFKISVEEVTADVVAIARELKLEVEPENGTELLQPCGKI